VRTSDSPRVVWWSRHPCRDDGVEQLDGRRAERREREDEDGDDERENHRILDGSLPRLSGKAASSPLMTTSLRETPAVCVSRCVDVPKSRYAQSFFLEFERSPGRGTQLRKRMGRAGVARACDSCGTSRRATTPLLLVGSAAAGMPSRRSRGRCCEASGSRRHTRTT